MTRLPTLYVTHGSPTLIIDDCPARDFLGDLGRQLPRPTAILCVSAHWESPRAVVSAAAKPETIHDFFGFPPALYEQHALRRAAFVTIDCDLYPSTQDALRFATPLLQTGTVLYFDDWYSSSGDMRLGEAGACRDWLAEHPDLELVDYGDVGIMGKLFLVNRGP